MQLRLFRAPRMAEAMAQPGAALGEEAVILETRRVAGGVEDAAALAGPDEAAEEPEPWLIPPTPLVVQAPPADPGARAAAGAAQPAADPRRAPGAAGAGLKRRSPPACSPACRTPRRGRCCWPGRRARARRSPAPSWQRARCWPAGRRWSSRRMASGRRAAEQMAAFTRVLGLTLAGMAPQPGTLVKALARRQPGQPVLIDTAG